MLNIIHTIYLELVHSTKNHRSLLRTLLKERRMGPIWWLRVFIEENKDKAVDGPCKAIEEDKDNVISK